jgi:hypothetical protein
MNNEYIFIDIAHSFLLLALCAFPIVYDWIAEKCR